MRVALLALLLASVGPPALALEIPFLAGQPVASPADGVRALALADLDGDGDLDALVGAATSGAVTWSANDGAGTFGAPQAIATAAGVAAVVAVDLDRDGDLDVAWAAGGLGSLAWHANDGSGTFGAAQTVSAALAGASALAAADLDADGDPDLLAAAKTAGEVLWFANDGAGGFGPAQTVASGIGDPSAVAAADLDRDGDLDVLWGSDTASSIAWHANDGAGGFGAAQTIANAAQGLASLAAADLDQDGALDVLAASRLDSTVAWYRNLDGAGSFGPEQIIATPSFAASAVADDVDRDGDPDVVVGAKFAGVFWHQNDGAGAFAPGHTLATGLGGAAAVRVADLDRDGDPDVAAAFEFDDEVVWYENDDLLTTASYSTSFNIEFAMVPHVALADFDRDGFVDIAAASSGSPSQVSWYRNDGTGSFTLDALLQAIPTPPRGIEAADLDRNGADDVILLRDDLIVWYANDGNGGFSAPALIDALVTAERVRAVDLDRDGDLDLVANLGAAGMAWYENVSGGGSFSARIPLATTLSAPLRFEIGDWDGDGDLDLLLEGDGELRWLANDGSGGFAPEQLLLASGGELEVGDFDRDGDPDVGVGTVWLENCGAPICPTHPTPAIVRRNGPADLDRDGDLDLAGDGEWAENTDGAGTFPSSVRLFSLDVLSFSGRIADIERDGDLDQVGIQGTSLRRFVSDTALVARVSAEPFDDTVAPEGSVVPALQLTATRNGGSGAADTELASLELRFGSASGTPLTSAQANALIAALDLYRDDGSGAFDPADLLVGSYAPLALSDGRQTLELPDGDPLAALDPSTGTRWFVVVTLHPDAGSQTPNTVLLRYLASGAAIERIDTDLAVVFAAGSDAELSLTAVSDQDSDGDGIPDLLDPCPSFDNSIPGGLDDQNADGIPNVCQCGDANNNNSIDSNDLTTTFFCINIIADPLCVAALGTGKAEANNNNVFDNNDLTRVFGFLSGQLQIWQLTCANRPEGTPPP